MEHIIAWIVHDLIIEVCPVNVLFFPKLPSYRFFEDLAIPKNKGYDSEFLELCNIRHNVIQQMCEYEDAQETNILELCNQNIQDAIQILHSGKAADELEF
jgi:hypothetical protein